MTKEPQYRVIERLGTLEEVAIYVGVKEKCETYMLGYKDALYSVHSFYGDEAVEEIKVRIEKDKVG